MALVWGGGGRGRSMYSAFPGNCSVSYLSFVCGRSLWAELNGGENSLHWKANMLPLFSIMTLCIYQFFDSRSGSQAVVRVPTCQHLGYSQSRSSPSKLCFCMNSMTCSVNLLRAVGLFTSLLYLSPAESFQPPMAMRTLTPRAFKAVTFS